METTCKVHGLGTIDFIVDHRGAFVATVAFVPVSFHGNARWRVCPLFSRIFCPVAISSPLRRHGVSMCRVSCYWPYVWLQSVQGWHRRCVFSRSINLPYWDAVGELNVLISAVQCSIRPIPVLCTLPMSGPVSARLLSWCPVSVRSYTRDLEKTGCLVRLLESARGFLFVRKPKEKRWFWCSKV